MADADKQVLTKIAKLMAVLREHQTACHEIADEIEKLLSGEPGVGALLKRLQHHFENLWALRYAPVQSGPGSASGYVWTYAKDVPHLKRLLKTLDVDEIEMRMQNYLWNDDSFYVKARHNFGVFVASINSHAGKAQPLERSTELEAAYCRHNPHCRSDQDCTRRRAREIVG